MSGCDNDVMVDYALVRAHSERDGWMHICKYNQIVCLGYPSPELVLRLGPEPTHVAHLEGEWLSVT